MSYSLIPTADYKAICDAIRAKTGKTDLIKSGDMAAEIESIETGSGGGGGEPYEGNPYLTFSSANAFTIATYNSNKNWNGALYYSNDTETWNEWDGTTTIASAKHDGEQRIYMRGVGNDLITGHQNNRWVLTGNNIACDGNIELLLDYKYVLAGFHPPMLTSCFYYMFNACAALISAPKLLAATLSDSCYSSMFFECTELTTPPELPATTLQSNCYYQMFRGCTKLTTPPKLPATTLASSCYQHMFRGCTALISVPKLPATKLEMSCYSNMFNGCTNIKLSETQSDEYPNEYRIPTEGTGISATGSFSNMFSGTGGTKTGAPTIDTTYYTANEVV